MLQAHLFTQQDRAPHGGHLPICTTEITRGVRLGDSHPAWEGLALVLVPSMDTCVT